MVGVDRLVQVIDRAGVVAFEHVLVFVVVGGEEDDRHAGGLLALLDHLGQLEAGHAGHADVQDEQGEFLGDEREQRLVGGFGPDQPVAGVVQDGFEHGEVLRLIVHDQDVDRARHANGGRWIAARRLRCELVRSSARCWRCVSMFMAVTPSCLDLVQRNSHTRISDSSWSVLTGLAM